LVVHEPLEMTRSSAVRVVVVDLEDDGLVGAVARRRDDHALGAGLQVGAGLFLGGEQAGALERDVDVEVLVRQLRRITDRRDLDLAQADVDPVLARVVTTPGKRPCTLS
jgi:hypothetical protein